MTKHDYTIVFDPVKGYYINLYEIDGPEKVKTFYLADKGLDLDRLIEHMDSLTDQQCTDYLKKV